MNRYWGALFLRIQLYHSSCIYNSGSIREEGVKDITSQKTRKAVVKKISSRSSCINRQEQRQPQLTSIVVRVTIAVMKHHDQKQPGEQALYFTHTSTSLFITEGSQDRNSNREVTWRQELIQRPGKSPTYGLASQVQPAFLWNLGHPAQEWDHT